MSYTPSAPDLKTELADRIRSHRKNRDNGGRYFSPHVKVREEAGRFTAAGEAEVTVEALVSFSTKYVYDNPGSHDEHRIAVGAVAKCHGNGCVAPDFEKNHAGHWLLEDDADKTAESSLPLVQAAREWAQSHAEKCRAQPYTGR
ncbi:hypothetical protein [Streptomyces sp. NPDC050704]|uniref:hypothetical protein n=1 Tax=Streptomyces sp. NPDC050704 TaxID=3157219 RepID=UPI00342109BD